MSRQIAVLFLLCFWISSAQKRNGNSSVTVPQLSLSDYLKPLDSLYGFQFSYINQITDSILIPSIPYPKSVEKLIINLEQQTSLRFERLDETHGIVRPYQPEDTFDICGRVVDFNGTIVPFTQIYVNDASTQTESGINGNFQFSKVHYNSRIYVRMDGRMVRQVPATYFLPKGCERIEIQPLQQNLDPVLIREYISRGITKKGQQIRMMPNQFEVLPGITEPDVLQTIQLAPGIQNPFETATGLYVRGGSPDQNLITWNGIKTYHQGHLFGMLSSFNPQITKDVTFYNKATPVQYGNRVSGVLAIRTEDDVINSFSGSVGSTMTHADAFVKIPLIEDKLSVELSGRRSFTDLWQSYTYDRLFDRVFQNTKIISDEEVQPLRNDFFFSDFTAGLQARPTEKDLFTVNAIYAKNDLDFKSQNNTDFFSDVLTTANEGYSFSWKHYWSEYSYLTSRATLSRYGLRYAFETNANEQNSISIATKSNFVEDWTGYTRFVHHWNERHQWDLGYEFSSNRIRYLFTNETPDFILTLDQDSSVQLLNSAFTSYTYDNENGFLATAGIRAVHYSNPEALRFEPRAYIEKEILPRWNINTSAEVRSQGVSQIQESVVSSLSLENLIWTAAQDSVFPIIDSYQFTLGTTFKPKNWLIDVDAYYKNIENITTLTSGFLNPIDDEFHLGRSEIRGADLFIKKKWKTYKSWFSYAYSDTRNRFDDVNNDKYFVGNWNIQHTVRWSHFVTLKNLQLSLGWAWHTGKAVTEVTEIKEPNQPIRFDFEAINGGTLPEYHRLDFSARYMLIPKSSKRLRYQFGMSLSNLYGKRNLLNREFRPSPGLDNQLLINEVFGLNFTPNLSVRLFW